MTPIQANAANFAESQLQNGNLAPSRPARATGLSFSRHFTRPGISPSATP